MIYAMEYALVGRYTLVIVLVHATGMHRMQRRTRLSCGISREFCLAVSGCVVDVSEAE